MSSLANGIYPLDGGFLSLVSGWFPLTIMCRWSLMSYPVKHVSDLGNQHNNGHHQDQIFDNPMALCLALWTINRIGLGWGDKGGWGWGGGRTDAPNRLFMKGVALSLPSDLLRWMSSRSKYNASTINYLLVSSTLQKIRSKYEALQTALASQSQTIFQE